ncbi:MAG: hypothetical protein MKZ66_01450 [Acidimicrobiales bacterium]|jgi:hypothetical protein|nr:hypothetical protein [Acidimicrobiales bacterium]
MVRLARLVCVLVAVTVVVWVVRVVNVFGDDSLSGSARLWRLLVAGCFLVFAGLAVAVLSGRWAGHRLGSTRLVAMFCLWTMVFWAVRSIGILLGDYDTEFTLVHVLLALVSVGVAFPVYRLDRVAGNLRRPSISDRSGRPVDR